VNRDEREKLRRALSELHRNTALAMRAARTRTALACGVHRALPLLVLVPIAWILLKLLGGGEEAGGLVLLPATVAIPALVVLVLTLRTFLREIPRAEALAVLDRRLDLEDRLQTAHEFLALERPDAFVEAALEDAASFVERARHAEIQLASERWRLDGRGAACIGASIALLVLSTWIGGPGATVGTKPASATEPPVDVASVAIRARSSEPKAPALDARDPRPDAETTPGEPLQSAPLTARRDKTGQLSEVTKESVGKTGEGRSSDAESTSGASESRGVPSNQAQTSKPSDKPSPQSAKKKKPKPSEDDGRKSDEKQEEDSGSTAGKGSSRGSNRNPAVSRWESKDQVTSEDDQDLEDDQETEDEEEDQESRGGVQPHLRDRKPPVSRDLRIG